MYEISHAIGADSPTCPQCHAQRKLLRSGKCETCTRIDRDRREEVKTVVVSSGQCRQSTLF